jgi:16S rRNA (uracil1498-N3)-methyltransferase
VEIAASRGCEAVGLGPRILRTETAPIAALAALHALWGDFRS